ncbi:MAG: tetratricopeptide repeat protein [Pyrinomonadaceae bacterium]|nr:tetratricopeptide repeat protein [Pyrinomonadaceae bacterium]
MSQERIAALLSLAEQQPDQEMIWYGLANEYLKLEQWGEAANALRRVITLNADFTAAYQMLGTALMRQGDVEEARRVWTQGIAVADRTGAWKARQHMEGLLAGAEEQARGADFCD